MKKATATQSDELAARVKALTDKLESGVKDVFESDAYINEGMSQVQTLKTLIHESAHAKLHALPVENGKIVGKSDKDNHTREVEAESIA